MTFAHTIVTKCTPMLALVVVALSGCMMHRSAPPILPSAASGAEAAILGQWVDDYGNQFRLSPERFEQLPRSRFNIVEWNRSGQYFIAQNDVTNPTEPGLWTRVDWMPFTGMAPFTWGFCLTAYGAPSRSAALATSPADRATPRTGCNGHPFSRMKRASEAASHDHAADLPPVTIRAGSLITEADVRFMQGMIAHHAQAVHMTRMASGAGASARVLKLALKIDLSQAGEITLMQEWLRSHDQFAPDTSAWRSMQMAGMLTTDELTQLAAARGIAFDRLFLRLMIRHHEGALQMVAQLLATPRAAQDIDVNILANDVESTQTAEIGLMWQMLAELE